MGSQTQGKTGLKVRNRVGINHPFSPVLHLRRWDIPDQQRWYTLWYTLDMRGTPYGTPYGMVGGHAGLGIPPYMYTGIPTLVYHPTVHPWVHHPPRCYTLLPWCTPCTVSGERALGSNLE